MASLKKKSIINWSAFIYFTFTTLLLSLSVINFIVYFINQKPTINYSFDNEKRFWQNITLKHPMYIDAYLELAKINMATGKLDEAKDNILNVYSIDPNLTRAKKIESVLGAMTEN